MNQFQKFYQEIYQDGKTLKESKKINFFAKSQRRPNSIAIIGGALGDEGKGRAADEITTKLLTNHSKLVHYRDNGGANAGHTVKFKNTKVVMHQLGASVLQKKATVVMGKEMVIHPEDLVTEIKMVNRILKTKTLPAKLMIDEMAFLCLDTHRAFEAVLKMRSTGSKGATGRGIAPAYADVIYRQPLRMRDLISRNWKEKFTDHYKLYQQLISGCGFKIAAIEIPLLEKDNIKLGSLKTMLARLEKSRKILKPYIQNVNNFLNLSWHNTEVAFVIEKAQALGLDKRWGVYPDVTASNCDYDGIFSSSEGMINPNELAVKAATIKATYTSSVGSRVLPTAMNKKLAERIRKDANEYGATTGRPRDIAHIDLPMLSFLFAVSHTEELIMTHLDISYPEVPIKVCVAYTIDGKEVQYRPDQEYLDKVKPIWVELPAWDGEAVKKAKKLRELPKAAQQYIKFISLSLGATPFMITTGPKRDQTIYC